MKESSGPDATHVLALMQNHGLSAQQAIGIASGALDLETELERERITRAARKWSSRQANRELRLNPAWDLSSNNAFLALDGVSNSQFRIDYPAISLLEGDVPAIQSALHIGSQPARGPWHKTHASKTGRIAYRWSEGLPVTPPLVAPIRKQLVILGGHHRFHLVASWNISRIPILIREGDEPVVTEILSDAHLVRLQFQAMEDAASLEAVRAPPI